MNVAQQIRSDLTREHKMRSWRTVLSGMFLTVLLLTYLIAFPVTDNLAPTDVLTAAVLATFSLFALVASGSSKSRMGSVVVIGLAIVGVATPWLGTRAWGEGIVGWGCAGSIAAFALIGVVAVRLGMGSNARRFGGGPQLYGLSATLAALLGVGLHCPNATALHIGTHVVAAAAIAFGATRLVFWNFRSR